MAIGARGQLAERSFNTITHSADIRQRQSSVALRLDNVCSKVPLEFDESLHGCHRWCMTEKAEMSFKQMAQEKKDFLLLGKIAGMDLQAREARYHESGRIASVRDDSQEDRNQ